MKLKANYIFYIIYGLLFVFTCNHCFFWDTIQLGSKHATFFYNTNLSTLVLPMEIDSGHPPLLGLLLAVAWKIFGRTLFVSHALMLPFVLIIVYQTIALTKRLFPTKYLLFANAVILCEATLMAQCTLVSPDIILVAFLLLALNAIIAKKQLLLCIAIIFLCMVSMRGMMCAFILFCFHIYYQYHIIEDTQKGIKRFIIKRLVYVPGVLITISFLLFHYSKTGWIGYHANSSWAGEFEHASNKKALFNFFILCWRMIDFGKLFTYIILAISLIILLKKKEMLRNKKTLMLLVLSILFFFLLSLPLIRYNNLLCHRYILPLYICINLLVIHLVIESFKEKQINIVLGLMIIAELTGNLWVYPRKVATGWDATLSHLPYYSLRAEAITYLDKNKIPLNTVGTGFPNIAASDFVDLKPSATAFIKHDLSTNKYVLYSNIFNEFGKAELDTLFSTWKVEHSYKKCNIEMIIFKKP